MRTALSTLALIVALVSTIAIARTDGIYNRSGNSVGDTQGIDSATSTGSVSANIRVTNVPDTRVTGTGDTRIISP